MKQALIGTCADRWKHETSPSLCCYGGKVQPESFPTPPPELMELWFGESPEARLCRQHARSINNAVCLSSLRVNERQHMAGTSSVVMLGKLTQLIGSLKPEGDARPYFAQLYTSDPATEAVYREGNFYLPKSLSQREKTILMGAMWKVFVPPPRCLRLSRC